MPLGIENNGISAGIIERGGAALSATIQQAGQQIQHSLLQQQTFRQAKDFGAALSQTDPASEQWPQQAAFLLSKYPLVSASGLAKPILEPMGKAFAGFQQAKLVGDRFGNAVTLEGLRHRDRMAEHPQPTSYFNEGAPSPETGDMASGQTEIDAPAGLTDKPMAWMNQAVGQAEGPGLLPPLNGADAIKRRYERANMDAADQLRQMERDHPGSVTTKNGPAMQQRLAGELFRAGNKGTPAVDQDLQDFADDQGLERIGDSNYFTLNGQGRYSVSRNAKGQFAYKDAPVSTDPDTVATVEGRRQISEQRRQLQAKATAAKALRDTAKNRLDEVEAQLKTVYKNVGGDPPRFDSEADFQAENPTMFKRWKELLPKKEALEKKYHDAQEDVIKHEQALSGLGEDVPVTKATTEIITAPNGKKYEVDHASKKVLREVP